jgi:hypothetical protein
MAVEVHHSHTLAGFSRTVGVKDLPAYGGGVLSIQDGIVTGFVGKCVGRGQQREEADRAQHNQLDLLPEKF